METVLKILILLLILLIPHSGSSFTFNNSGELAFKKEKIDVYFSSAGCTNIPYSNSELLSIIDDAINDFWNTVSVSSLYLENKGTIDVGSEFQTDPICTNPGGSGCTPNSDLNVNSGIVITCNIDTDDENFSAGVLGLSLPINSTNSQINGSVVLLNDRADSALIDLERHEMVAVVAHEIGHALGFGHSTETRALMYASLVTKRTKLGLDDIHGVSYLYPIDSSIQTCLNTNTDGGYSLLLGSLIFFMLFSLVRFSKKLLKALPRST